MTLGIESNKVKVKVKKGRTRLPTALIKVAGSGYSLTEERQKHLTTRTSLSEVSGTETVKIIDKIQRETDILRSSPRKPKTTTTTPTDVKFEELLEMRKRILRIPSTLTSRVFSEETLNKRTHLLNWIQFQETKNKTNREVIRTPAQGFGS